MDEPQHEDALAALHRGQYASLVRLAALVLGDTGLAEQVVQDAFVRLHARRGGVGPGGRPRRRRPG